ncbi:MAG: histidine--tRNA ligase, partial [Gammaproteobacteria bacterium]|nr:histidine--tRNA ligase [Gammaproteobacteria bacterium]
LGGHATPAIGFAMGLERLTLMLETLEKIRNIPAVADVYICMAGEGTLTAGLLLAEKLRNERPELRVMTHCGGGNFKKQMKRADKVEARIALILGESEVADNKVTVKFLRDQVEQQTVDVTALLPILDKLGE